MDFDIYSASRSVRGAKSVARLAERLSEIPGVTSVQVGDGNLITD